MDDRMDINEQNINAAEDMTSAPLAAPETPADYPELTDEEVVALCRTGDTVAVEYLLNKYKNFVRSKARSYFLIGADHEDIVQEGMIGLYKAIGTSGRRSSPPSAPLRNCASPGRSLPPSRRQLARSTSP